MALRLNHVVLGGEVINTEHYSTHGWLELRGRESPLLLQLTGNCGPELAGCHFRFTTRTELEEPRRRPGDIAPREASDIEWLADQQVGPTGTMTIRQVKWFNCPADELYRRCKLGEPPPFEMRPSLYLEWHSQNGRVVLELVDPEIELIERRSIRTPAPGEHLVIDPLPVEAGGGESQKARQTEIGDDPTDDPLENPSQFGLGITRVELDDEGQATIEERLYQSNEESDLFGDEFKQTSDDDLQRHLDEQTAKIDWAIQFDCDDEDKPNDVRELELMDALIERRTADWMIDMIDHPEQLPAQPICRKWKLKCISSQFWGNLRCTAFRFTCARISQSTKPIDGCWKIFLPRN